MLQRPKQWFVLVAFLSIPLGLIAQKKPGSRIDGFALDASRGFTILHHPEEMAALGGKPLVIQGELIRSLNGYKHWHKYYNFPNTGVAFQYMDFDNSRLGRAYALTTFLEPQFFHNSNPVLTLRMGTGIVYATNPFHPVNNPDQVALGSRLNAVMHLKAKLNFQSDREIRYYVFGDFTHYSNGSMQMPNAGINVPSFGLGFSYIPATTQNFFIEEREISNPKWQRTLSVIIGGKESSDNPGVRRAAYGVNFYISRRLSPISAITIGADYDYNLALRERLRKHQSEGRFLDVNQIGRVGAHIGHELYFGNVSLLTQFAAYVHRPYQTYRNIYQRYGLRWKVTEDIVFGTALRTHLSKADYIEFSIGYQF